MKTINKKKRPDVLSGKTHKVKTQCGNFYLTQNFDDGELYEIKMDMGKSGNCQKGMLSAMSILYSILLQAKVNKEILTKTIKRHLLGVSCGQEFYTNGEKHTSCLDWAAKQILKELKKEIKIEKKEEKEANLKEKENE